MIFEVPALTESLKSRISLHIDSGRFPHASIISGADSEQIYALAHNIARALVCVSAGEKPCGRCAHCAKALKECHPDIISISREKDSREIKVEQIRAIVRDAVILPNEAESKVYIIREADTMNAAAQNAFLKLLEEPPSYAVFLLLAENSAILLQTVRSRCSEFDIERGALSAGAKDDGSLQNEYLTLLFGNSELATAEFALKIEKLDRLGLERFLGDTAALLAVKLRENALSGAQYASSVRLTEAIKLIKELEDMQDFNVSSGHIAGMLAVKTAKIIFVK